MTTSKEAQAKRDDSYDSCVRQGILEQLHKLFHDFSGKPCRDDGGWCDARDHADAALQIFFASINQTSSLRSRLTGFVERERGLLDWSEGGRKGQSVGRQPSVNRSVLKELERMLRDAE